MESHATSSLHACMHASHVSPPKPPYLAWTSSMKSWKCTRRLARRGQWWKKRSISSDLPVPTCVRPGDVEEEL